MEDFVKRLIEEEKELSEKREKLSNFITENETFEGLSDEMKHLLSSQLIFVDGYLLALKRRIALLTAE